MPARNALTCLALLTAAAFLASGCAASTEEDDADSSADAVSEATSASVSLPSCMPRKLPEGANIRMMVAPKYVFTIQGNGLHTAAKIDSDTKLTISRRTRGASVPLGAMKASSGEVKFTVARGDVAASTFVLDFGPRQEPLSAAEKQAIGKLYVVYVLDDGWLGDSIAQRCEAPGS